MTGLPAAMSSGCGEVPGARRRAATCAPRIATGAALLPRALARRLGSAAGSTVLRVGSLDERALLSIVIAVAFGLIAADAFTWIELNVATLFGLPLVLSAGLRRRRLLWALTASLAFATFAVYALQTPGAPFTPYEKYFVSRVLDALALLLVAGLLHAWMAARETSEEQTRLLEEQKHVMETARVSRRMAQVQESERRALASELHDLVGQKLTALEINLNIVKSRLPCPVSSDATTRLDDSLRLVVETIGSIRNVMTELRPAVLDDFGLAPALRWYAEQFAARTGIATAVAEKVAIPRLAPKAEEALFRIAQEALANVAKYSRARSATLSLACASGRVCLAISDDGCGFDAAAAHAPATDHGWGFMIMRERASAVGARVRIDSGPGRGTRVTVDWTGEAP
jgi:signal transduction histidine kinase